MMIPPVYQLSFGFKSILKTYWLQGKMPTVTKGIYGGELTKDNITLEHLKPCSKGGTTKLSNLALSKNTNNWIRSNKPIQGFLTKDMFDSYCEQFKGIKLPNFNGDEYIRQISKTLERLTRQGK